MVREGSKKSSKSTKPRKKPNPPAEHQPVKQIAEIPIALVEIGDLAKQIHDLIGSNWTDQQLYLNSEKIMILAGSCIQVIKTDGLTKLRLDQTDSNILLKALRLYGRYDEHNEIDQLRIRQLIELLVILTESNQQYELIAKVNPLSKAKEAMDRVLNESAMMEVSPDHFVMGQASEYPGICERIDQEIELVNQMMEQGVESGKFKVKILAPSKDEWICTQPSGGVRTCRVCRCTDDDCRQCVEKTGRPCHWVEPDLCSACVQTQGKTGYESSGVIAEG